MKLKETIFFVFFTCISTLIIAQNFNDYLPASFHKERREILRSKMPKNSIAVLFSNPIKNRSNDVDYVFHQEPNFYYLTGFREPNSVIIIYSDTQTDTTGNTYKEIIYVPKKDSKEAMWHGERMGIEGVKTKLGFSVAKTSEEFISSKINFKQFDHIFINQFEDDYRNSVRKIDETYDLVKSFKKRAGYDPSIFLSIPQKRVYELIRATPIQKWTTVADVIDRAITYYPSLKDDKVITGYRTAKDDLTKKEFQKKATTLLNMKSRIDIAFLPTKLAEMREIKTPEELRLLTKAINISVVGQIEVMKAIKPQMSEREVQGIHEFIYKKYGADDEGYPGIVGAGNNGCTLHYIDNNKKNIGNNLILMDLGAEYRGYSADVTRTIPANGKFSPEQKAIYELVLKAQNAGILACKEGNMFSDPGKITKKIINQGLYELGVIKSVTEKHTYFPHGTSHHIGLDVHDPGTFRELKENMVITVEPGIYIPKGSPCDKKWWGIAIRIEDDILITNKEPKNLSKGAPKTVKAIEKMMAKKSVLNDWILPDLD